MPPTELPLGWPSILRALIAGPGLWATPAELVDRVGLDRRYKRRKALATAVERCTAMLEAGWLEGEATGRDAVVTLSEKAAERLGVRIADGEPRWEGFDLRKLPRVRYYSFSPDQLSVFFEIPDTGLDPSDEAAAAEEFALRTATDVGPHSLQVGHHWIWLWRRAACDVGCRNVPLRPGEHCLTCGRPHYEVPDDARSA
jgi:hypothetical protein